MIVPVIATILLSIGFTQAVGLNGLCNSDTLTCTDANTYCSKQSACTYGYCVCNSGYSYNYNSGSPVCEAEKLIGDSCTSFCTVGTCTSGRCACSSTQTASSDRRSCIGKKLGETCSTALECQGYSAYSPGIRCSTTCQCAAGYQAVNDYACLWYDDGDACTSGTTVCGSLATCTSGTCQCNTISGTKYEWYTYTTEGVTVGGCVHPSSTKNVGYGQTCTSGVVDATAKFCSSEYICTTCPGSTSYVCLNGVGQIRASYFAMVATLVLGIKLFFF